MLSHKKGGLCIALYDSKMVARVDGVKMWEMETQYVFPARSLFAQPFYDFNFNRLQLQAVIDLRS